MKRNDHGTDDTDDGTLNSAAEMALREGLRALQAPTVSADFDARVLRGIHGRSPFWDMMLASLRPALATAAVSTAVTTLLLSPRVTSVNPALVAAPRPPAARGTQDARRVSRAIAEGSYLSMRAWRPAPSAMKKPPARTPGG